jgi:hypothetical protein
VRREPTAEPSGASAAKQASAEIYIVNVHG